MNKWSIYDVPVIPKFTEDFRNILKVNTKKEVFFDVFECGFNGGNIMVEKIGEEDGLPIVQFETIRDKTKLLCKAFLVTSDKSELFLNESSLQFVKNIDKPIVKTIIQEKVEKVVPKDTIYENKIKDLSDKIIAESEEKAQKLYDSKLLKYKSRRQKINQQAEQYLNNKSEKIKQELNEQFIDFLSDNDDNVKKIIKRNIKDISLKVDESINSIISKVEKLSGNSKQELIKILSENINTINKNIDDKIEDVNDELEVILHDNTSKINKLNKRVDDYKVDTLKAIVEKVTENKNQIEKSLKNAILKVNERIDLKGTDVKKILSEELTNINEKLNIFSKEEDIKYKQLLENINDLNKVEVKEILSEKISESQINSLKLDITKQFQKEITSMKRYAEMSSGGGTNAVQYANGGTMNGSLTVTDTISAGNIVKADRLNVGSGNLFVDNGTSTGNAFVKMGAYGAGNFFGKEGSVNGATFSLGVGSAGKIVEDMKIDTFALSGAGLVNKQQNPVILIPTPGANKYNVPVSIQVYKSQSGGTRVAWGNGAAAISIGTFASSDTTGVFSQLTALPRGTALIAGDWLYNRNQGPDTINRVISNRALAFRTSSNITSNSSADVYYLKVRYMVMSEDGDFKSIGNLQIKDS